MGKFSGELSPMLCASNLKKAHALLSPAVFLPEKSSRTGSFNVWKVLLDLSKPPSSLNSTNSLIPIQI